MNENYRRTHLNRGTTGSGRVMSMRGVATPTKRTVRMNQDVPEGKARCEECGRVLTPRIPAGDSVLRLPGHQAQKYLPCVGSRRPVPTTTQED